MGLKKFPVYIPAGSDPSENEDPLLLESGVTNKALIEINGKKIIEYVLEAVNGSKYVDRIFIVGITEEDIDFQSDLPIDFIPSVGSRMDTLKNLMNYLEDVYHGELPDHLLVLSADIPLITSNIIDQNIDHLKEEYGDRFDEIELFYPLVPENIVKEKYPFATKRFRKFSEGRFATGDMMIFSPAILRKETTMAVTEKIMESRKTIVRLLLKFDFLAPIKYLLGRLSIRDSVFPFLKDEFDVEIDLLISEDPEICVDLDYPEDITQMELLLS